MEPERAVAALDRLLTRALEFEKHWEQFDRDPEALWRTPWEHAGRELAADLAYLSPLREYLQAARTLLAERQPA